MTTHILIVEDDEMIQSFITLHLENEGYRVSKAATGAQGIDIFTREEIDLILLDLNLPDGDGLSIAQQIREKSSVPIIILTARQGLDDKLIGLGLGADDYLTKPVDPQELFLRVRNLLDRAGKATVAPPRGSASVPPEGTIPREPPVPHAKGGSYGVVLTILVLIVIGGGSVWWFLDRNREVAEAPKTAGDPSLLARDEDPQRLPEVQSDRPLSATSFSWVLKSKCEKVPYVSWWRAKTRADIVGYVVRRHAGNWKPYIKDWTARLIDLQDSYSRGKGVRTPEGEVLIGQSLKGHIDKTQKRLDVMLCLSREAAEYSRRKNLRRR